MFSAVSSKKAPLCVRSACRMPVGVDASHASPNPSVRVSTFVDSGDNPRWKAVCSEFPFIDDEQLEPRRDSSVYDTITNAFASAFES